MRAVMDHARDGGAERGWGLERGASVIDDGVRFEVWAPRARGVTVEVSAGARFVELPLEPLRDGVFAAFTEGVHAGADYRFRLTRADGTTVHRPDPVSRWQPYGVHGSSRVVDPRTFRWMDGGWSIGEMADQVIYELHVGAFTTAGSYAAAGNVNAFNPTFSNPGTYTVYGRVFDPNGGVNTYSLSVLAPAAGVSVFPSRVNRTSPMSIRPPSISSNVFRQTSKEPRT
jgi:hypothetical protein